MTSTLRNGRMDGVTGGVTVCGSGFRGIVVTPREPSVTADGKRVSVTVSGPVSRMTATYGVGSENHRRPARGVATGSVTGTGCGGPPKDSPARHRHGARGSGCGARPVVCFTVTGSHLTTPTSIIGVCVTAIRDAAPYGSSSGVRRGRIAGTSAIGR